MSKKNVLAVIVAFVIGSLGSVNTKTVPVKAKKVVVVSATTPSVSFGGGCALANQDNMCGSKKGEWCEDDNDCCAGKCSVPAGKDAGTCQ